MPPLGEYWQMGRSGRGRRDVVISLLAAVSRQERIRLSERVVAGLARAKREGWVGGRPRVLVSTRKIQKLTDQGLRPTLYADFHHLYEAGLIQKAACWAHVRRKFYDLQIADAGPLPLKGHPLHAALMVS